jgi:hypothetical protein
MACPWAVGSSSSRGCLRRPQGLWRSRESRDKTCSLLVSRGWAQVGRVRHTALPKLHAAVRYSIRRSDIFPHSLHVCLFTFLSFLFMFSSVLYPFSFCLSLSSFHFIHSLLSCFLLNSLISFPLFSFLYIVWVCSFSSSFISFFFSLF